MCRIKKSNSAGEQLKEAQAINKSLSALGDVISALASEAVHIPYRNHKLTMLMSDSLGGTAKTLMFVNVSPTDANIDETNVRPALLLLLLPVTKLLCLAEWFSPAAQEISRSLNELQLERTSCKHSVNLCWQPPLASYLMLPPVSGWLHAAHLGAVALPDC